MEYASQTLRRIQYLADFNGLVKTGVTYAHSFSEIKSQLEDAFYNVRLIQIEFLD